MMTNPDLTYLKGALGLDAKVNRWSNTTSLPLYVRSQAEILALEACGAHFLLARLTEEVTLPEIKRLHAQLSKRVDVPVVVSVPDANARQRKALVSQGVPFICAGRQVFLPFLGMASTEWGKDRLASKRRGKLSPKAQQAAIWGVVMGSSYTLLELREAAHMSASQASDATSELIDRGLARREKRGRTVIITPVGADVLLEDNMACLSTPVLRTIFVPRDQEVDDLPDAGETELAARGMLNPPTIRQKALSRRDSKGFEKLEILEGELPDEETAQIQIWKYDPVFSDFERVDAVSLALSLANITDERVESEISSLFGGRELPWQQAL